jgi:hypothetical protein
MSKKLVTEDDEGNEGMIDFCPGMSRRRDKDLPDVPKKRLNAFLHLAHHGGAGT